MVHQAPSSEETGEEGEDDVDGGDAYDGPDGDVDDLDDDGGQASPTSDPWDDPAEDRDHRDDDDDQDTELLKPGEREAHCGFLCCRCAPNQALHPLLGRLSGELATEEGGLRGFCLGLLPGPLLLPEHRRCWGLLGDDGSSWGWCVEAHN